MRNVIEKTIVLVGEEQGDIKEFDTCWEAYNFYQKIKEDDKKYNITDKYTFEFRYVYEDEPSVEYTKEMKIYRRGKKLFYKFI